MSPRPDVTGYILAGGHSRRMKRDKRWIDIGGLTLLERACNLIEGVLGASPFIVGDHFDSTHYKNRPILPDAVPDKGPLGGLVTALKHCPTRWALLLPVDMPFLSESELNLLLQAADQDCDTVAFQSTKGVEPLPGLYRPAALDFWTNRLHQDTLSLREGFTGLRSQLVPFPGKNPPVNLNTEADLLKIGLNEE